MIPERLILALTKANTFVTKAEHLNFITRCVRLQEAAICECDSILSDVAEAKAVAITERLEDFANQLLCIECIVHSLKSQLKMWVNLKSDCMHEAWRELIQAQNKASLACRAHVIGSHMAEIVERLELVEAIVFPPQIFQSAGMVIEQASCSICNAEYGKCDHLKGIPYLGEFCVRVIEKCTFTEVSMVEEPADKNCIVLSYSTDGKRWIDRMTMREIDRSSQEDLPSKENNLNGKEDSHEG